MKIPKPNSNADIIPCPTGLQPAVCIGVVALGTTTESSSFGDKTAYRVRIMFELLDETRPDGKPFTISKKYTLSMHPKSLLKSHLTSWRGVPFTEADFGNWSLEKVIGATATLNIGEWHKQDSERGTSIESVLARMKNLPPRSESVTPHLYFNLDTEEGFDQKGFDALPDYLKEAISKSKEYQHFFPAGGKPKEAPKQQAKPGNALRNQQIEDEIPF
jgi:hypothetical protein